MMRSKIALFLVFAISMTLLLSSCSSLGGIFGGKQQPVLTITEESLRTGTDSLKISFYENQPPKEVYEGQNFQIGFVIENRGASDISNGKLVLAYDSPFLQNDEKQAWVKFPKQLDEQGNEIAQGQPTEKGNSLSFDISGKSIQNPEGDMQIYSKNFKTGQLGGERQSFDASITATACYNYNTIKGVPICIDTMPLEKTSKPCQMKELSMDSQGAPVAITKVAPRMIPVEKGYQLEVDIYLQNKGKGTIFQKNYQSAACGLYAFNAFSGPSGDFYNTLNENDVKLSLSADSGGTFRCGPFPFKISEKGNFIRCEYQPLFKVATPYTTLLLVEADYGYMQSIVTTAKILKKGTLGTGGVTS